MALQTKQDRLGNNDNNDPVSWTPPEECPGAPVSREPPKPFSRLYAELVNKRERKTVTRPSKVSSEKPQKTPTVSKIDEELDWELDEGDPHEDESGVLSDDLEEDAHNVLLKQRYRERCHELNVGPSRRVIQNIGGRSLCLAHHLLSSREIKALANSLTMTVHLTMLDLSDTGIDDKSVQYLTKALLDNRSLETLVLARNNFKLPGLRHLSDLLLEYTGITHLDISGNHSGDRATTALGTIIQEGRLEILNLSCNELGIPAATQIGRALGLTDFLLELDLSWNHIRLDGASAIAKGLLENSSLKSINLAWNGFSTDEAKELGQAVSLNSTLVTLDLTSNRLSDQAVKDGLGLARNRSLQSLKLARNPISCVGAVDLLQAVCQNNISALSFLDLTGVHGRGDFLRILQTVESDRQGLSVLYSSL